VNAEGSDALGEAYPSKPRPRHRQIHIGFQQFIRNILFLLQNSEYLTKKMPQALCHPVVISIIYNQRPESVKYFLSAKTRLTTDRFHSVSTPGKGRNSEP
jgi:hypothetical protein